MSKFTTTVLIDLKPLLDALPPGHAVLEIKLREDLTGVDVVWDHDKFHTGFTFPVECPDPEHPPVKKPVSVPAKPAPVPIPAEPPTPATTESGAQNDSPFPIAPADALGAVSRQEAESISQSTPATAEAARVNKKKGRS